MTSQKIRRLNTILGDRLGRNARMQPKYKWQRTSELFYFIQEANRVVEPSGGNRIALVAPTYRRVRWSERIGDVWVLAQWRPPMDGARELNEHEWERMFGNAFPYPNNGLYYPFAEMALEPGVWPDEALTDFAIFCLSRQIDADERTILNRCNEEAEKIERDTQAAFNAQVDEEFPKLTEEFLTGVR